MSVDRAKALADYAALESNLFWLYFLEQCGERMRQELLVLKTSDSLTDIYRGQGRADVWGMMARFPGELAERLGK